MAFDFNFLQPNKASMGGPLAPQNPVTPAQPGGQPSRAAGSAPMNILPGDPSMQPGGTDFAGFMQQLMGLAGGPQAGGGGAAPNPISGGISALAQMFNPSAMPKAPSMVADWMLRSKTGGLY